MLLTDEVGAGGMDIIGSLLRGVEERYGHEVLNEFRAWFERSGHADVLDAPLLRGSSGAVVRSERLDALPLARASRIEIANPSDAPVRIGWRLDLTGNSPNLDTLFDRFVHCCSHTNSIGHFREEIPYYAQVYTGQRYLMGHGDGSCGSLGLMLQSLARRLLGIDVAVHYVRTAKGELTHVFCTHTTGDGQEWFLDADQKTRCPLSAMEGLYPYGFLFQLFAVVGYEVYARLDEDTRRRLFPAMTHRSFENHRTAYHQASYQKRPSIAMLAALFRQATDTHHELVRIEADDFPWKARMRAQAVAEPDAGAYFLCRTKEFWDWEVPAGGRIAIGFAGLPTDEIGAMALVFVNRAPATVWVDLRPGEPKTVVLPEMPWMIVTDRNGALTINGQKREPTGAQDGSGWFLGGDDLEALWPSEAIEHRFELRAEHPCKVGISFPINGLAFNSGLVESRQSSLLNVSATLASSRNS